MEVQEKNKTPLVLGIISIVLGFLIPIAGLICGIIGLVSASNNESKTKLDYKTEKVVNIIGIVVSVGIWIIGILTLIN